MALYTIRAMPKKEKECHYSMPIVPQWVGRQDGPAYLDPYILLFAFIIYIAIILK